MRGTRTAAGGRKNEKNDAVVSDSPGTGRRCTSLWTRPSRIFARRGFGRAPRTSSASPRSRTPTSRTPPTPPPIAPEFVSALPISPWRASSPALPGGASRGENRTDVHTRRVGRGGERRGGSRDHHGVRVGDLRGSRRRRRRRSDGVLREVRVRVDRDGRAEVRTHGGTTGSERSRENSSARIRRWVHGGRRRDASNVPVVGLRTRVRGRRGADPKSRRRRGADPEYPSLDSTSNAASARGGFHRRRVPSDTSRAEGSIVAAVPGTRPAGMRGRRAAARGADAKTRLGASRRLGVRGGVFGVDGGQRAVAVRLRAEGAMR